MKATGFVRKTDGNTAEIETHSIMEGCASCSTGNCSSCGPSGKTRTYKARNSSNLPLRTGDLVEISIPAGKAAAAFVRVILMPLLFFFVFYGLTALLTGREEIKIAGGFAGMAAGFAVNFLVSKKVKDREMPDITRIFR